MNVLIKYYLITFIFYILEIIIFQLTIKAWIYDIFWLNMILRLALVSFFSIIVRNTIFKDSNLFYVKFFTLILLSPLAASTLLKFLTILYPTILIVLLKFISDLISSVIVYLLIRKIA